MSDADATSLGDALANTWVTDKEVLQALADKKQAIDERDVAKYMNKLGAFLLLWGTKESPPDRADELLKGCPQWTCSQWFDMVASQHYLFPAIDPKKERPDQEQRGRILAEKVGAAWTRNGRPVVVMLMDGAGRIIAAMISELMKQEQWTSAEVDARLRIHLFDLNDEMDKYHRAAMPFLTVHQNNICPQTSLLGPPPKLPCPSSFALAPDAHVDVMYFNFSQLGVKVEPGNPGYVSNKGKELCRTAQLRGVLDTVSRVGNAHPTCVFLFSFSKEQQGERGNMKAARSAIMTEFLSIINNGETVDMEEAAVTRSDFHTYYLRRFPTPPGTIVPPGGEVSEVPPAPPVREIHRAQK